MQEARLKASLLEKQKLSQSAMASLVSKHLPKGRSIGQSAWSDYESGESDPPYDVVQATARVSEMPPEYLAFGVMPVLGGLQLHDATEEAANAGRARKGTARGK